MAQPPLPALPIQPATAAVAEALSAQAVGVERQALSQRPATMPEPVVAAAVAAFMAVAVVALCT